MVDIVKEVKEQIICEEEAGVLVWTVYCIECGRTIDKAFNGVMMEGTAKLHAWRTGHKVILGNVFKRK